MNTVKSILAILERDWSYPRPAVHRGEPSPFLLECKLAEVAADHPTGVLPHSLPEDLKEFWETTEQASLFRDPEYGQWGIELLSPREALEETVNQRRERPTQFLQTDLVIGTFYGDSDLLVVLCDPNRPDFGSVLVALPLDDRVMWPIVGSSLRNFLNQLMTHEGDKFWEP